MRFTFLQFVTFYARFCLFFQIKTFIPKVLERNFEQDDIGVITPYYAQVVALRKELKSLKKVRVGTVEEFQGEEKKVIIISTVKTSGKDKALQFIYCPKRLNTAISRARSVTSNCVIKWKIL